MKEALSLLLCSSTYYFNNILLLHMQFRFIVANQNKKTKTGTLYILKTLYSGCSMKEVISLLLSRST